VVEAVIDMCGPEREVWARLDVGVGAFVEGSEGK
jgi:hypothetical protein